MITPSGAAAITYDLMTPVAIGRHSWGEPRLFLLPLLGPASRRGKYCELLAIGLRPCKMSARRDGTLLSVAALCPQRLAPSNTTL